MGGGPRDREVASMLWSKEGDESAFGACEEEEESEGGNKEEGEWSNRPRVQRSALLQEGEGATPKPFWGGVAAYEKLSESSYRNLKKREMALRSTGD